MHVGDGLYRRGQESNFAHAQLIDGRRTRAIHAEGFHLIIAAGIEEANLHARPNSAINDAKENNHAAIRVVPRVEDQSFERRVWIAFGRRHVPHDRFQHLCDSDASLGAGQNRVVSFQADEVLDLFNGSLRFSTGQVDLIDDRNQLEIIFNRQVSIRQRLGFDAL